jgi:PEGA domain
MLHSTIDSLPTLVYTAGPFFARFCGSTFSRGLRAMSGGLRPYLGILTVLAWTAMLAGCVERRFIVYTDPPTAILYVNGKPYSATPADDHFVYYGNYHFTLVKDGFETLQVDQYIAPPWFEHPVLDFFSENVFPLMIRDVRPFKYTMTPLQVPNTMKLRSDATALRSRGQAIQTPPPQADVQPALAAPVPVATPPATR